MMSLFADPAKNPSTAEDLLHEFSEMSVSGHHSANLSGSSQHQQQRPRPRSPKRSVSHDSSPRRNRNRRSPGGSPHASRSPHRKGRGSPLPDTSMTDHLGDIEAFCKVIKAAGSEKASELIMDQIRAKKEANALRKESKARVSSA